MGAVAIIICGIMGLVFMFCVTVIVVAAVYDRRATRRQKEIHQSYFRQ